MFRICAAAATPWAWLPEENATTPPPRACCGIEDSLLKAPRNLNEPIASLTVQIYNYAISPYDEWHAQAWAATLVLMALILSINIGVRFLTRKKFS